jgi:hypothetical protein
MPTSTEKYQLFGRALNALESGNCLMLPRSVKNHILPLAGYTLLTLGVTYPSAFRLTTHIPGTGDAPWFLWDLWWFKHALLELRQSPLVTDIIYHPIRDVPVTWQTPINEFFSIPLQTVLGVVILYNVLFLSTFVLSGYCMYLLALDLVRRRDLAFIAGIIFAFCSYRSVRGLGHLSLLTTQWMPLALLLMINCWRRPTPARGIAAGVGVSLVALSSPYYVAYFLLPVGLVAACYLLGWGRKGLRRRAFWQALALGGLVIGLSCVPFYYSFLKIDREMQATVRELAQSVYDSPADLLSWALPPGENPLWMRITGPIYDGFTTPNLVETTVFFGFLPPLLALASGLLRWPGRRSVAFWQALALLTFLFSFGPVLHVNGKAVFDWMPYRALMAIPGFDAFRIPSRAGITAALAGTVLAVLVLERSLRIWPNGRWLLPVWAGLLLVNMTFEFPFTSSDIKVPSVYEQIAQAPGRGAVLELPAGELYLDRMSWYMYYQTLHQKPLVSGYLGRRPARLYVPQYTVPFIKRFFTGDPGRQPVDVPSDQELATEGWPKDVLNAQSWLRQTGIAYVVLHCDGVVDDYCGPATMLLNKGIGLPIYQDPKLLLYAIGSATPDERVRLQLPGKIDYGESSTAPAPRSEGPAQAWRNAGPITMTLPLAGTWSVEGELESQNGDVAIWLDGEPVMTQAFVYSPTLRVFAFQKLLAAGKHTLQMPVESASAAAIDQACQNLCIRRLTVNLDEPAQSQTSNTTRASFADSSGIVYELTDVHVLENQNGQHIETPPSLYLLTQWHKTRASAPAALPDDTPALYVHITDSRGNTLGQADHPLGEHGTRSPDGMWLYDLVTLPSGPAYAPDAEMRIGLWFPNSGARYWVTDRSKTDEAGSLLLKSISALQAWKSAE